MPQFFLMPQASPTMTVGVVSKWVAAEGAALEPQSVIAQVETDKATMDVEVFDKGVMLRHLAREGQEVPPGVPIAILGTTDSEDITALLAEFEAQAAARSPAATAPADAPRAEAAATPQAAPIASAPPPAAPPSPPAPSAPLGAAAPPEWNGQRLDDATMESRGRFRAAGPRVIASPLAKVLASERGVNLARVRGSGPGGRIVAADVEGAPVAGAKAKAPPDEVLRVTQMRKTIARRLTEVHQQVPVFYLTATFDAGPIVALKDALKARGARVSINDVLVRCAAAALRDVPEVNAQWQGESIVRRGGVDIGVAVALPEGLVTPVVRDADQKGFAEIGEEIRALAALARDGKLQPEQYTGGTFTISNLGMFDIDHFTAILNPPEAAILAVGAAQQAPVIEAGQAVARWRLKVTMTCDHRVVDGALGARFLAALRQFVENPGLLAV
jgi:pyruvate dehydrogenase E2 component (dihydrolipoamide acetyltransferase)